MVQEAKRLRRKTKAGQRSLRAIAAELATLGYVNERGTVFSPSAVASRGLPTWFGGRALPASRFLSHDICLDIARQCPNGTRRRLVPICS
jgi:hypothetical protein